MSSTSTPETLRIDRLSHLPGAWSLVVSFVVAHISTAVAIGGPASTPFLAALLLDRSVRFRVMAGGQYGPLVDGGQWWRLVRSLWLHADAMHLIANCVAVWALGRLLEPWVGSVRLVWWFMLGGLGASIASQLAGLSQSDGASGGAFALLGAVALLSWKSRDALDPRDRRLLLVWVPVLAVLNLVLSLLIPFVDVVAHAGGLGVGLVLGALARPEIPSRRVALLECLGITALAGIAITGPYW